MTLQQLEYIVAIDTHRHFARAAEACFVTQPTLSTMVKKLEDEFGVEFFDRRSHPVQPTSAGIELLVQARVVLREATQMKALVKELRTGTSGTYRIGIIPTLAPYLLPLFLTRFAEAHPQAQLRIDERRTSRVLEGLRTGKLDIGILAGPVEDDALEPITLFHEPFLAYLPAGHSLLKQRRIGRKDLRRAPLWVLGEGHCLRDQALSICQHPSSAGHDNILYCTGSIETLKRMVDSGSGVTLVPELSVGPDERNVRRFMAPEPAREVVLVVRRPFVRRKAVDALVKAIRAALPQRLRNANLATDVIAAAP